MGDPIDLKLVKEDTEIGWLRLSFDDLDSSESEGCFIEIHESTHDICGVYKDWDYDHALGQVRKKLESEDIKIACYAVWKFILYSGISRDMGKALVGYDMSGEGFSQKGHFGTFDPVDPDLYSELLHFADQRNFQRHIFETRSAQITQNRNRKNERTSFLKSLFKFFYKTNLD